MRLVTNPGSNLTKEQIARYKILMTPQQVIADGVSHFTPNMTVAEIERLVRTSKSHPYVLGTSAAEFVTMFRDIAATDREILVITSSRKLIGSYDAAVAAARTLQSMPSYRDVRISIVDSTIADVGAGYITMFCAASAEAGKPVDQIIDAARRLAAASRVVMIPTELDYLSKSGRASFLKTMAATLLQKLPVIAARDGEMRSIGTVSRSVDLAASVVDHLTAEAPPSGRAFVAVVQGKHEAEAPKLQALLRERYTVHTQMSREWSPGIFLTVGPSLGAFVLPLDAAPWSVELDT